MKVPDESGGWASAKGNFTRSCVQYVQWRRWRLFFKTSSEAGRACAQSFAVFCTCRGLAPCKVTRRLSRLDAHRALETFATLAKQKVAREQCKRCPVFLGDNYTSNMGCF